MGDVLSGFLTHPERMQVEDLLNGEKTVKHPYYHMRNRESTCCTKKSCIEQ